MFKPFQSRHFFLQRIVTVLLSVTLFFWFYEHVYRRVVIGGQTLVVEDVTTKNIIRIRKDFDSGDARKLRLYISGSLNGKAELVLFSENTQPQSHILGPGKVELPIESPWHDPSCTFEYMPQNGTRGSLSIRYLFSTEKKR